MTIKADTEFIFSHKLCVENAKVQSEQIYISKAMVLSKSIPQKVCTFADDRRDGEKNINFLRRKKKTLLKCFQGSPKIVYSYSKNYINSSYSQIILKTLPIRFTVKFNNHFAIIKTYK